MTTTPAIHTDATAARPATAAGLVVTVVRESGYVAGYVKTFAEADDLVRRCNANVPSDPARVQWMPTLDAWLDAATPGWDKA